jgi:uncharacterized spore protein YtfJ
VTRTEALESWNVSAHDFPEAGDTGDQLLFLLRYAVLAPSGHNTQPWLFSVDGDTVELYADRTQALAVVDPEDRELTISCGAALFNLRVALRHWGYRRDDQVELLPDPADADLLARVRLVGGEPPAPEEIALSEAIPGRRTNDVRPTKEVKVKTDMQNGAALADELLRRIGQTVGDRVQVSTVFGEPVDREGITVMPVAKARFGFGGGGGAGVREGEGSGAGGGGGASVSPVGYIEVRDGTAQFKRITTPVDVLALVAAASLAALVVRRLLVG